MHERDDRAHHRVVALPVWRRSQDVGGLGNGSEASRRAGISSAAIPVVRSLAAMLGDLQAAPEGRGDGLRGGVARASR